MKSSKLSIATTGVFILLFSFSITSVAQTTTKTTQTTKKSTQTTKKSTQTTKTPAKTSTKSTPANSKSTQKQAEPVRNKKEEGTVKIGDQYWALTNLNVNTFRNGDSIPEVKSYKDWVTAGESGKPAWCYYNNDPASGAKYGKLYNWYAVNDPRELAPDGWTLASDEDWAILAHFLGGANMAGTKLKSASGWSTGDNGKNEAGFGAFPGGYRIENGLFQNVYSIATWWSSTESSGANAIDRFITLAGHLDKSNTPKQRGQSVRCLRK